MSAEAPREKTAKELEKERKKAEKLAKFQAKQAAKASSASAPKSEKKKKEKEPKEEAPVFKDETKPGDKKILISLDDPALKAYVPSNVESSWYDWWKKEQFFTPKIAKGEVIAPENRFVIPAPPPNVTGALHIGHALTISIQDSLIRFNRMRGKTTLFIPGFDHAGISTQSVVEKMIWNRLGKTRHDYGREKFVDLVWEWKEEYHERIRKQLEALGASYDWTREAFTMDESRYAAVVEAFVQLFDDGTIYRANRLVNWCTALNTTLSNLELDNKELAGRTMLKVPSYDEPVEFGVITSFGYPVVGSETGETLVVATTRPETVFGDTAVAVHPEDSRYKHLHGKKVKHPLLDREIPIILDAEAVDMEFGTGAVKITPAHDLNDYETGKRNNLEFVNILTDDGLLNENAGPYAGTKRFDARRKVIEDLKAKGLFVEQKDNPMSIPTCAKSGDIIEPIMKPQWWVHQKEQAEMAIQAVKRGDTVITPKTSENEFFAWMRNMQDWCISRQLWWGHRCPVYHCTVDGEELDPSSTDSWVAGRNLEEAQQKANSKFPGKVVVLSQDEDVLDTWFSSGLWPFSTIGWPNLKAEDLKNFAPMDMLETGWDILFFWVVRMMMLGLKLTGKVPFKEVYCHSLVRDAQGRKMSKSLGNVIDPLDVISGISLPALHDKLRVGNLDPREIAKAEEGQKLSFPNGIPECGTDALRFALCAYTTGGRDINLDIYRIEGYRKFCNKIYQATKFALMRLGPDFVPKSKPPAAKSLVEKWILHKLSVAAKSTAEHLDARQFMEATSAVYQFWLYEFCDVYIENSKFLILEGTPEEQRSAQDTLYTCLDGALRLIHPFMPFITEELWQRLPSVPDAKRPETIALSSWPSTNLFDKESEEAYDLVLEVVKNSRSLLAEYNIIKGGEVILSATGKAHEVLNAQQQSIVSLVKAVEKVRVTEDSSTPAGAVVASITPECRVFVVVKGHVDLDEEIRKAELRREKIAKSQAQLRKQTEMEGYETKVKPNIREQNTKKLESFEAELGSLAAVIKQFEQLKL